MSVYVKDMTMPVDCLECRIGGCIYETSLVIGRPADCPLEEAKDGDLISRAGAIEAVCRTRCGDKAKGCPAHSCLVIEEFDALLSAETHDKRTETHGVCSDLISREGAINAVALEIANMFDVTTYDGHEIAEHALSALPSAKPNCFTCGMENGERVFLPEKVDGGVLDADTRLVRLSDVCKLIQENYEVSPYVWGELRSLPSAEAVQGWIPFTRRPMTEEEQKHYWEEQTEREGER